MARSPHADQTSGSFHAEVLRRRLLTPTGAPGAYSFSAEFEDTVSRVDRAVTAAGAADGPEVMRFPPIIARQHLIRSRYLESFPQLAGWVHSFSGDDRAHRTLLSTIEADGDWSAALTATDVVLTPAACYPVYPQLTGTLPAGGRLVDVMSFCFRHEPSADLGRMQMFRMHEFVRLSEPAAVIEWRDTWLDRSQRLMGVLGLEVQPAVASDPFFGRGGKLLAANQRDDRRKIELCVAVDGDGPTAIASLNAHQDRFGQLFDIRTPGGQPAHSACVGFGLERIALAIYRHLGFDRSAWLTRTREVLGL
jgi:seryl-tRNA synthetase